MKTVVIHHTDFDENKKAPLFINERTGKRYNSFLEYLASQDITLVKYPKKGGAK